MFGLKSMKKLLKIETILFTDASPVGISAILIQKAPGEKDDKIVAYSSKHLPRQNGTILRKKDNV